MEDHCGTGMSSWRLTLDWTWYTVGASLTVWNVPDLQHNLHSPSITLCTCIPTCTHTHTLWIPYLHVFIFKCGQHFISSSTKNVPWLQWVKKTRQHKRLVTIQVWWWSTKPTSHSWNMSYMYITHTLYMYKWSELCWCYSLQLVQFLLWMFLFCCTISHAPVQDHATCCSISPIISVTGWLE